MMLLKRVRVANVAPFLFLRWTPCLLFIFLLTPLDNIYAQDDDSGEIFWGEDEEDEEFFEEDEEFLEDDEEFDEDPDAFLMKKKGKTNSSKMNLRKMNLTKKSFPVLIYPMRP